MKIVYAKEFAKEFKKLPVSRIAVMTRIHLPN